MKDYAEIESSQRQHQNEMSHYESMCDAHETHCFEVVKALGLTPKKDGNQWCYLLGENLQVGVAGFGDTVMTACINFYENLTKVSI